MLITFPPLIFEMELNKNEQKAYDKIYAKWKANNPEQIKDGQIYNRCLALALKEVLKEILINTREIIEKNKMEARKMKEPKRCSKCGQKLPSGRWEY